MLSAFVPISAQVQFLRSTTVLGLKKYFMTASSSKVYLCPNESFRDHTRSRFLLVVYVVRRANGKNAYTCPDYSPAQINKNDLILGLDLD